MQLTIGKLAQQAGVSVETIRYYERRGLIDRPRKPAAGYRRYDAAALDRVRFIKQAQGLGFTLDEIGNLMGFSGARCSEVRSLAAVCCFTPALVISFAALATLVAQAIFLHAGADRSNA